MPQLATLAPMASALADPARQRLYAQLVLAGADGLDVAVLGAGAGRLLARLAQAGLVELTAEGSRAAVREQAFADALRAESDPAADEGAKLLKDGRIAEMPVRPARRQALLEYLTRRVFEPGVSYGEPEVNIALRQYWEDTSALRRYLVDARLLTRSADGRSYRVTAALG
ncbi:DUF2087 domain-containing protein [Streptacidiphilus sp. PAMC 29251]